MHEISHVMCACSFNSWCETDISIGSRTSAVAHIVHTVYEVFCVFQYLLAPPLKNPWVRNWFSMVYCRMPSKNNVFE